MEVGYFPVGVSGLLHCLLSRLAGYSCEANEHSHTPTGKCALPGNGYELPLKLVGIPVAIIRERGRSLVKEQHSKGEKERGRSLAMELELKR